MTFTDLPPELKILILCALPSIADLSSVIRASPDLLRVYLAHKPQIITSIILLSCPNLAPSAVSTSSLLSPALPYNPSIPRLINHSAPSGRSSLQFAPLNPTSDPSFMSHRTCSTLYLAMGSHPTIPNWIKMPSHEQALAHPDRPLALKHARYFIEIQEFKPKFDEFMGARTERQTEMKCLECGKRTGMYYRRGGWPVTVRRNVQMRRLPGPPTPRVPQNDTTDTEMDHHGSGQRTGTRATGRRPAAVPLTEILKSQANQRAGRGSRKQAAAKKGGVTKGGRVVKKQNLKAVAVAAKKK